VHRIEPEPAPEYGRMTQNHISTELSLRHHENSVPPGTVFSPVEFFSLSPFEISTRSAVEIRIKIKSVLGRIEPYLDQLQRRQRENKLIEIGLKSLV